MTRTRPLLLAAFALLLLAACPDGEAASGPPKLRSGDALTVAVVVPEDAGAGLRDAAEDLTAAMQAVSGATGVAAAPETTVRASIVEDDALGDEGYRLDVHGGELRVTANTETGLMYGLYQLAGDLGVQYIHPEQTWTPPADPAATLPWAYDGAAHTPRFARRGFHEHTQHPIVMSDFLLRPGDPHFREYLSHYLRWMARNRQNTLSFHMLKTVDLETWTPYMADVVAEANAHGVRMGAVIGFVDQQQNAFKMIYDDAVDAEGAPIPAETQIRDAIDRFLASGLNFVGFQIGTSEFTKPNEAQTLAWLDTAVSHVHTAHPGVDTFAWIHITCSLHTEDGGYFYHLPLRADPNLGAFVHTTMFYTLEHPAPVYDCENFRHQREFFDAADGQRELVFFPESAWWLGFDNNVPLALPITGRSREYDILSELPAWDVDGHVTFTTGREWGYWRYDHYLTRVTWDGETTWDEYLREIGPVFGPHAEIAAAALTTWTDLQWRHLYEESPLTIFYLAGELPQDEIGEAAGILARRPKLSFKKVVAFDDAELAAWEASDLAMLETMEGEYAAVLATLPEPDAASTSLYVELHATLTLYVERIRHALALYRGVVAVRAGDQPGAEAKLAEAEGISAGALEVIGDIEQQYRYPLALLAEPKPESLTSYPYGYLYETSTAYFWTRRDDQLAALIAATFGGAEETWETPPDALFAVTSDQVTVLEPTTDLAAGVLGGFMPRLLFGLSGYDEATGALTLAFAQDHNDNDLPDAESELKLDAKITAGAWEASTTAYSLAVYDTSGTRIGDLVLVAPTVRLEPETAGGLVTGVTAGELEAVVQTQALMDLVRDYVGIDEDGLATLLKSAWDLPPDEPLPQTLPVHFAMTFTAVAP